MCWCGYLSGSRCRLFAYGPADATAIPKTPSSPASFKPRLLLPFWYRLTQVVLEKRPLNGCSSISRRLCNSQVSFRPSVCLSRRSIACKQRRRAVDLLQPGRRQQISINICCRRLGQRSSRRPASCCGPMEEDRLRLVCNSK